MKIYYYAFTGHKYGLDRARRAAAILKKLRAKGFNTMLLVNDFRAGLATRDLGVPESVHIEGIQDIDAIAENGDIVIIDSPEDDHGRLVKYCADFKKVFRFAEHDDDKSIHGEIMLTINGAGNTLSSLIVDDLYFEKKDKETRTLFFLGDSDANKTILSNSNFFKENEMELLLGHYFYVKYENDLSKIFKKLHESDEYKDLILSSTNIVTASFQTALEASVAGANVIYIDIENLNALELSLFNSMNIGIVKGFDTVLYKKIKLNYNYKKCVNLEKIDKITDEMIDMF